MILGVDHLALSCLDVWAAGSCLRACGATEAFTAVDLQNDEAKRPYLQQFAPTHDIGYWRFGRGVAVELTRHRTPLRQTPSSYQVLLSGPIRGLTAWLADAPASWAAAFQSLAGTTQPRPVWSKELSAQFWIDSTSRQDAGIEAVLVPTKDLEASERFWVSGLGGRLTASGEQWRRISYRRPVASWSMELILAECRLHADSPPMLDAAGAPCVALLTNHLALDLERARAAGGRDISPSFGLVVNKRKLIVSLLRGPSDEIVELIEVARAAPAVSNNES